MHDVTELLSKIEAGDDLATSQLLPLVYEELKNIAASQMLGERVEHTLQGTALVHEAYLRLLGPLGDRSWDTRGHFFAAAAEMMRRILIESARAKKCQKRHGDRRRVHLIDFVEGESDTADMLLDLDEGLTQLATEDAESAELVKLRLFAGLSVGEAGELLGMSRSTAYENWDFARSWFSTRYANDGSDSLRGSGGVVGSAVVRRPR